MEDGGEQGRDPRKFTTCPIFFSISAAWHYPIVSHSPSALPLCLSSDISFLFYKISALYSAHIDPSEYPPLYMKNVLGARHNCFHTFLYHFCIRESGDAKVHLSSTFYPNSILGSPRIRHGQLIDVFRQMTRSFCKESTQGNRMVRRGEEVLHNFKAHM